VDERRLARSRVPKKNNFAHRDLICHLDLNVSYRRK
jgi:hypothetical protein